MATFRPYAVLKSGPFSIENAVRIDELQSKATSTNDLHSLLMPADRALWQLPEVVLGMDSANFVTHGNQVQLSERPADGLVRMYGPMRRFLGNWRNNRRWLCRTSAYYERQPLNGGKNR